MRDLIILSIVGIGAAVALRRPWIGVMLWTWLSIMNPHRYGWGAAYSAPVAAIAAGSTLLGLLFTSERQSPFKGAAIWWLAAFSMWITLSWQMGMDPAGDQPLWSKVMKIYLMTFVALSLLSTELQIKVFAWVTVGSIGFLAVKGGLFTILTAGNYRVFGPPESFIADNNDFALATVIAIPMLRFLQLQLPKNWMRYAMTGAIVLCAASALGSQSRGGAVALAAMGAVFWFRSPNKITAGILITLIAIALLPLMPEQWWDRMDTISRYTEDESAMGRINAWHVAWQTALHNFFGGGMSFQHEHLFRLYGQTEDTVRAAHSIYFQILGNHGFVGLFLFMMIWIASYRTTNWLRRNAKYTPEARWAYDLGSMVQVSLVGFAVGGAFLSLPYFDLPYNLMIMAVLAKRWVRNQSWETESAGFSHGALEPMTPKRIPE